MIVARWRQTRLWHIETALLEAEMVRKEDQVAEEFENADDTLRLAAAFDSLARDGGSLVQLQRHEARLRRQYERALRDLKRLQAERSAPPPPAPPSTVQNEPTAAPTDSAPSPEHVDRGARHLTRATGGKPAASSPTGRPDRSCMALPARSESTAPRQTSNVLAREQGGLRECGHRHDRPPLPGPFEVSCVLGH